MDECLNNHTRDLCLQFQNTIQVVTNSRGLSNFGKVFRKMGQFNHGTPNQFNHVQQLPAAANQALVMLTATVRRSDTWAPWFFCSVGGVGGDGELGFT